MTVSGVVIVENDTGPKAYKSIQVALNGGAHVHWSEAHTSGTGTSQVTRHYSVNGNETFIQRYSVLWDKNRDAAGGMYPVGTYHYQFSFQLAAPKLPPTHYGHVGQISYIVDATVHQEGASKYINKVSAPITVANAVAISHPSLQQPCSKTIQRILHHHLCFNAGPIAITATVPRTGYCIGHDSIPLEVTVENGSSRTVQLAAEIEKHVTYSSNSGRTRYNYETVARIASSEPTAPHTTFTWKPEAFGVPYAETTSESCAIVKVSYSLRVTGDIIIPLVLGNIPLTGPDAQSSGPDAQSAGPTPVIFNPSTQGPPFPGAANRYPVMGCTLL